MNCGEEEELEAAAAFCRTEGLGLEVTAFAWPATLDRRFEEAVDRHTAALRGVPFATLHGPFLDLYPASVDPAVVELCHARHERALEAAVRLGARTYVAHLAFLPIIRSASYRDGFTDRTASFWRPLADRAAEVGITIALENLWEPDPGPVIDVLEAADRPNLKVSFDNGHGLVFSDLDSAEWIESLGEDLAHLHLHDNEGECDAHLPIGEGEEDWPALLSAVREYAREAILVLESDRLAANRRSLARLREWLAKG